jgi:hypothetical protein
MSGPFLPQTATTSLVNVKLTDKGRELLTKGFFEQDTFDIVKFAFGDSEVDYSLDDTDISGGTISRPDNYQVQFKSKLYVSGTIPSGTPHVALSTTSLELTENQGSDVQVTTVWPPVAGTYLETYRWENLGPLNDWDYDITTANNTRTATIIGYDVTGTTQVKVTGQITGRYAIIDVTIGT